MLAESAQIVDFQAYRASRRKADTNYETSNIPQIPSGPFQPMVMWVPVWAYFPVMAGAWIHAQ